MLLTKDKQGLGKLVYEQVSDYMLRDLSHYIKDMRVLVFGGAVRDALSGDDIHDIDVVGTIECCGEMNIKLQNDGWKVNRTFGMPKEQSEKTESEREYFEMYNLFALTEMHHKDDSSRQVHLIVPKADFYKKVNLREDETEMCALLFAANVDLSNCAVAYNMDLDFISFHSDAVRDCLTKRFKVLDLSHLKHEKNIAGRIQKFKDRGWTYYEGDL